MNQMSVELHPCRIPYVSDLGLGPRAIVVNYLAQGALGLLLGSILSFHFAPPRDNPNLVLKVLKESLEHVFLAIH